MERVFDGVIEECNSTMPSLMTDNNCTYVGIYISSTSTQLELVYICVCACFSCHNLDKTWHDGSQCTAVQYHG